MQLIQFAEPIPGQEPADALRSAVFMANFAAQDITGSVDASRGVSELIDALAHPSPDARTYLFAATTDTIEGPTSDLGYPLVPSTGDGSEPSINGWLIVSAPQMDNVNSLELSLILDVELQPMESAMPPQAEETIGFLLTAAATIGEKLGRSILQLWQQYPLREASPLASVFASYGFEAALEVTEYQIPAETAEAAGSVVICADCDFPAGTADSVAALYSAASIDQPLGSLQIEQEKWDEDRLAANTQHFRSLGTRNYHALAFDEAQRVIGLSEVWVHQDARSNVAVQGLTYVLPEHRDEGLSIKLAGSAIAAARAAHPDLSRVYASAANGHTTQIEMINALGGQAISRVGACQRLL